MEASIPRADPRRPPARAGRVGSQLEPIQPRVVVGHGWAGREVSLIFSGSLTVFNGTGAVTQVLDSFEFLASGLSGVASGVLTRGKLVWTSGLNNGLAVEIKAHSSSAGVSRIAIALPMGAPVVVGDTFSATAGCDRTFATCRDRFANTVNFGGFPHMPGNDAIQAGPSASVSMDGSSRFS